jgi:Zn-dependent alcohol dehydrogenase
LITHDMSLEELEEAFELMMGGTALKIAISP